MRSVLIVDDESDALVELAEGLQEYDIPCFAANNTENALAVLQSEPGIGAIMTDLRMPGGSGLSLLRLAHKMEMLEGKAVFLVSGYLDAQVRFDIAALGIDAEALPKPLDIDGIAHTLAAYLT